MLLVDSIGDSLRPSINRSESWSTKLNKLNLSED